MKTDKLFPPVRYFRFQMKPKICNGATTRLGLWQRRSRVDGFPLLASRRPAAERLAPKTLRPRTKKKHKLRDSRLQGICERGKQGTQRRSKRWKCQTIPAHLCAGEYWKRGTEGKHHQLRRKWKAEARQKRLSEAFLSKNSRYILLSIQNWLFFFFVFFQIKKTSHVNPRFPAKEQECWRYARWPLGLNEENPPTQKGKKKKTAKRFKIKACLVKISPFPFNHLYIYTSKCE